MKPAPCTRSLRFKAALFALSFAAMTTQVGSATAAAGMGEPRSAQLTAAAIPVPAAGELLGWLAWLERVLPAPPISAGWALLAAGIAGVWVIGHRRMSAPGGRSLDPYGPRRR